MLSVHSHFISRYDELQHQKRLAKPYIFSNVSAEYSNTVFGGSILFWSIWSIQNSNVSTHTHRESASMGTTMKFLGDPRGGRKGNSTQKNATFSRQMKTISNLSLSPSPLFLIAENKWKIFAWMTFTFLFRSKITRWKENVEISPKNSYIFTNRLNLNLLLLQRMEGKENMSYVVAWQYR